MQHGNRKGTNYYEHYSDFSLLHIVKKNDDVVTVTIDKCFLSKVMSYVWAMNNRYPATYIHNKRVYLTRFLMNPPPGMQVDHINGNRMCFMKSNLRVVTPSQNQYNAKMRIDNTTGYKGVKAARSGKFEARLHHKGEYIHLGTFNSAEDAARAYDAAAVCLRGECARTNFKQ